MQVLGKRANMCLFVYPVLFVLFMVISVYFGQMLYDYSVALANDDMEAVEQLGKLIDKYSVRRSYRRYGVLLSPLGYIVYSVLGAVYSIYAFNRRITQPMNLIECDDKGFYLNLPFNKTWYVLYEEVLVIDIRKNEDMLWLIKPIYRHTRTNLMGMPVDPDAYINVKSSTFGLLKTGTIVVGLMDREIKIRGVKNALDVAKKMQVICNDGKRAYKKRLEEKEQERREYELREKTKT